MRSYGSKDSIWDMPTSSEAVMQFFRRFSLMIIIVVSVSQSVMNLGITRVLVLDVGITKMWWVGAWVIKRTLCSEGEREISPKLKKSWKIKSIYDQLLADQRDLLLFYKMNKIALHSVADARET